VYREGEVRVVTHQHQILAEFGGELVGVERAAGQSLVLADVDSESVTDQPRRVASPDLRAGHAATDCHTQSGQCGPHGARLFLTLGGEPPVCVGRAVFCFGVSHEPDHRPGE